MIRPFHNIDLHNFISGFRVYIKWLLKDNDMNYIVINRNLEIVNKLSVIARRIKFFYKQGNYNYKYC